MADFEKLIIPKYEPREAEIEIIAISLDTGDQADISFMIKTCGWKDCPLKIWQKYDILRRIRRFGKGNKEAQKLKQKIEILQFEQTKNQLVEMLKQDLKRSSVESSESSESSSESPEHSESMDKSKRLKLEDERTKKRQDLKRALVHTSDSSESSKSKRLKLEHERTEKRQDLKRASVIGDSSASSKSSSGSPEPSESRDQLELLKLEHERTKKRYAELVNLYNRSL